METFNAGTAIVTALGDLGDQIALIIPAALVIAIAIWSTTLGKKTAQKVAK